MFSFIFTVEPHPSHPQFYEIQAAIAFIVITRQMEAVEAEKFCRGHLERQRWEIQEVLGAWQLTPQRLADYPPEIKQNLQRYGLHSELIAYETGGGPERPERPGMPSWLKELMDQQDE